MVGINHNQVKTLRGEVYDLMVKEDCLWHQQSRVQWLKERDMNTGYFHNCANQRNRRNYISKLVLDDGAIIEEEKQIGDAFLGYFSTLFQSGTSSTSGLILQGIEPKVTQQMNDELTWPFITVEVEQALKQMKPMTAPGPDGMPLLFFKSY